MYQMYKQKWELERFSKKEFGPIFDKHVEL